MRISSIEVIHVRDSVLEALRGSRRCARTCTCRCSRATTGCSAAMGRHYDAGEYLQTIARLREAVPHINVTTDVIVGFPNEDEQAFQRTLELVEEAGISRVHTFPYSSRPGTAAEALGDLVAPEEKKRRSRAMRGLSEVRSRQHRNAQARRTASGCSSTRSPTRSARATPRTTPAATCRPGPAGRARCSTSTCTSCTPTACW